MIGYIIAGIELVVFVAMFVYIIWLQDRERERHRAAQQMLQRQLMALVDKVAVSVADDASEAPRGKVHFMDDDRMAALDASKS